jgi:polyisoprenoid-binding protein YceI
MTMKSSTAALFAAFLAFTAPALAQGVPVPPASVKAGDYAVEPNHTQIVFSVLHIGFTYYSGTFSGASGSLHLDSAHPGASTLSVSVPVNSVQTTNTTLDGELKSADWFDAATYPAATFVSTKVVPLGKGDAKIYGNFTLHGVTKPLVLTAHFVGAGPNPLSKKYTVGFAATGIVKRSEYGVTKYVPLVGDDVKLTIAGAFELQN